MNQIRRLSGSTGDQGVVWERLGSSGGNLYRYHQPAAVGDLCGWELGSCYGRARFSHRVDMTQKQASSDW
jgi:hypothetical protein